MVNLILKWYHKDSFFPSACLCSAFVSVVSIFREVPLIVTSLPSAAIGMDFYLLNKSSVKRCFLFPLIKTKELQIWVPLALSRLACLTWLCWSNYCAQYYLIWLARTKLLTNSRADGKMRGDRWFHTWNVGDVDERRQGLMLRSQNNGSLI